MLKITRINASGVELEATIDTNEIVGTSEIKVAPTELFDANGNVVDSKPNDSIYEIYFKNGNSIRVKKDTYDKLVKKLNVETL